MKNKNKWLRPKNPRITLKSGVQLSIQSGDGYQARPYTEGSFEVMVFNIDRCPYGWHKYHQSLDPWSESSVFVYVPAWFIAKYIDRQGISESQEKNVPEEVRIFTEFDYQRLRSSYRKLLTSAWVSI